jgi:Coenzyme PQQ synthesis protein D (PqqD)
MRAETREQLFSQRVVCPEKLVVRELAGEAILLSLDSEKYYGLDDVGFRMWTVLTGSDSIGAAYERLLSEYEVQPQELLQDLDLLIKDCMAHCLLEIIPVASAEAK